MNDQFTRCSEYVNSAETPRERGRRKGEVFCLMYGSTKSHLKEVIKIDNASDIIIEVERMGLTPDGKFRHPRFIRERCDK